MNVLSNAPDALGCARVVKMAARIPGGKDA
jgi:hypothetical protein